MIKNNAIALLSGDVDSTRAIKMILGWGIEILAIRKQKFPSGKLNLLHIGGLNGRNQ